MVDLLVGGLITLDSTLEKLNFNPKNLKQMEINAHF